MARYVLVAFDDNAQAEEFVNALTIKGGAFFLGKDNRMKDVDITKTFVRGLWMKPTQLCECPPGPRRNYVRGAKWGAYVCTICAKSHPGWAEGQHLYTSLGKNLLPVSPQAPEWRGTGVVNHVFDEGLKNWVHMVTGVPFDPQKAFRERKDYHAKDSRPGV